MDGAFTSLRRALRLDGSGLAEPLTDKEIPLQQPYSWSADGKVLAFQEEENPETEMNIWVIPMEGDREPQPFLNARFNETHPAFSPEGGWEPL